jgi:hypothetical protein
MENQDYLRLKGVTKVGYSLLMNEIESNLKLYLDWALLQVGGWSDVTIPENTGYYGGDFYTLHYIQDPSYTDGQIWETPRLDLVHESGAEFEGNSPIAISGVYIDDVFYAPDDATYSHYVDYPNGRIVFDNAVDTTSVVTMNYSYRDIQVDIADDSIMWKELQYGSLRVDDDNLSNSDSGDWTGKPSTKRQQLPAIIIEVVSRGTSRGYELGNGSLMRYQDVVFHIVSEDRFWRNQLCDMLMLQKEKTIWMFNTNEVADSGAYPLDYRGTINPDGVQYPVLVNRREEGGYRWRKLTFSDVVLSEVESWNPRLYQGNVRATLEVIYGNI